MSGFRPIDELDPALIPPDEVALSERDQLILELVQVGVHQRKAENLVRRFPAERIRRQLEWLPYRSARRPAPLVIAAIENDYDKPAYAEGE